MGILTRGDPVLKERDVLSHQGYQRNFGVMKDNSLILGKNRMTIQEQIEESCLMVADSILEQAMDQGTKTIMDLFKSAILKKYKIAFDHEIKQGEVHKKNVDKTIDFLFSDMCVTIRQLPKMSSDNKDQLIQTAKRQLAPIKETVFQILVNKGVQII